MQFTVNGVRYRKMITIFLWTELENMDVHEIWFQQDGANCHTTNEIMTLVPDKFNDRVGHDFSFLPLGLFERKGVRR